MTEKIQSYFCEEWDMTFGNSTTLLYRYYVHSDNRPFRCEFCNKGFAERSDLQRHTRSRDVVLEIRCSKCLKNFRVKMYPGSPQVQCENASMDQVLQNT
ncbi:hypothetical protein TNCV_3753391 [Trichonephila clavipes]|nr:hypothetical protein TNCV_3753391 [Trichonephila clavipes]